MIASAQIVILEYLPSAKQGTFIIISEYATTTMKECMLHLPSVREEPEKRICAAVIQS